MLKTLLKYIFLGVLYVIIAGNTVFAFQTRKTYKPLSYGAQITKPSILTLEDSRVLKSLDSDTSLSKMSTRLEQMISRHAAASVTRRTLSTSDLDRIEGQNIKVVLHTRVGSDVDVDKIESRGGKILRVIGNIMVIEVPIKKVADIVSNVDGVEFARLPHKFFPQDVQSEGVNLTGANLFHAAGFTGAGVKVAVIDIGFKGLSAAQSSGDIPYAIATHDYTGKGLETEYKHGTGCAEIIHDMVPDAELHLLKVSNDVNFLDAVDYCVNNGIDIISLSIGFIGSDPGNGTGPVADLFSTLKGNGIFTVAAAGNKANMVSEGTPIGFHWKGAFFDAGVNDWWQDGSNDIHQFIPGDSESNYDALAAFPDYDDDGNPETNEVQIVMRWNDWPAANIDYDLFLLDYHSGELIAYSNVLQNGTQPPMEIIEVDLPDIEDYIHYYALVVTKKSWSPPGTDLELFLGGTSAFVPFHNYFTPIATSSSSITAPGDVESVFTVGAIDQSKWSTGPQEDFSSQGPTNAWGGLSARVKPDICGPDATSGLTYGNVSFFGTSAAAPHVAGGAALILSMHPNLTPDQLQSILESSAVDMGSPGKDNLYGWGRMNLNIFNSPPVLDPIGNKSINEGEALTFLLSGIDPDEDSLIYTLSNLPPGAAFDPNSGEFTWVPGYDQAGVYENIHLEVSDGFDSDWEKISITVNNVYYDIDDSGVFDLSDVILALQICAGIQPASAIHKEADIDGDDKIGLEDAVHALQIISGIR